MTRFRLFSVLFSSFWLVAFYVNKLKQHRKEQGALKFLLDSVFNGPRVWKSSEVRHHAGHCYVINLDRQFLSDQMGKSVIFLLEDGKNLPLPNTRNVNEIIEKGAGRYIHLHDKLLFSPSDNAAPDIVKRRQYVLLESMSSDSSIIEQLLSLNKRRATYRNELIFYLEKLRCYLPQKLSFSALAEPSVDEIKIHNLSLNLSQWFSGQWQVKLAAFSLRQETAGKRLQYSLKDISVQGITEPADLNAAVFISEDYSLMLENLSLNVNQEKYLQVVCQWQNQQLQKADVNIYSVAGLRQQLLAATGGDEQVYENWLRNFFGHWCQGDLGLTWQVHTDTADCIVQQLLSASSTEALDLSLVRKADGLQLKINSADKMKSEVS